MSKFKIVKEQPKELAKNEYFVPAPNFLEEIATHKAKAPKNNLTGLYHLRMIADSIAQKYDPENMTGFSVKAHMYEGRPFSNDEELNTIIVEMMMAANPKLATKFLDKKLKERPAKTQMVYIMQSKIPFLYETCYQNGLADVEDEKRAAAKNNKKQEDTKDLNEPQS